jgi:TetR/AcrR family transcriptional regulator, cholesterol catabolism regulator
LRLIMETTMKVRIMEKAKDLFMRYGIRSVTMDEIASQLGISKKTIYQFFTDKDQMVEAVVEVEVDSNQAECLRCHVASDNPIHEIFIVMERSGELLRAMNPLIMYDLEKHHPKAYKKFRDYKYQFMYKMLKDNIELGIKEELYRKEIDVDIIARQRIESAFLIFNQDVFPHSRFKISEVGHELTLFFLHGIVTAKGKKLIEKYSKEHVHIKQSLYE